MSVRWTSLLGGLVAAFVFVGLLVAGTWLVAFGLPHDKGGKPAAPATVPRPVKEEDLNVVTLTPEAARRLGIRLATAERKAVPRIRTFGGEVTVPPGRTLTVSAPLAGVLRAPGSDTVQPGQAVRKGQPVFVLLPLLTPEARTTLAASRVEAEGQVKNAQTQLEAAKIALDRATRLLREEAGSKRAVDEAQAQHDVAARTLDATRARHDLLAQATADFASGTSTPLPVAAPDAGLIRTLAAREGETVPAGAALFEVQNAEVVWVRVPVYVGEAKELAAGREARVGGLADPPGQSGRPARPVAAPPSANAAAATVDLYYELANPDKALRPGQRVGVTLPLAGEEEALVVPWSAVIHDVHGNTWVYESPAAERFVRRRVAVRHVAGEHAVLARGPVPKTRVVAEGAAELFGTETGFAK